MKSFNCSFLLLLASACVCTALLRPASPFDANEDAQKVHKALEDSADGDLADIMGRRTGNQRVAIAEAYKTLYNKNLIADFEDELSGDFEDLMINMVTPLDEYYVKELFEDAGPFNRDSRAVVDILCTNTNALLLSVNEAYKRLKLNTRISLPGVLNIVYQGLDGHVIGPALHGMRNETQEVDEAAAIEDAKKIHAIGLEINGHQRRWSQEKEVTFIFTNRSFKQLQKIITEYEKLYGHSMERAFKDRVWGGDMEKGFLNMINVLRSIPKYYARRLYDSMNGMGTHDRVLMRIIIGRSEIDMDEIKAAFKDIYGQNLAEVIEDDTSGDYRRALLHMVTA